MFHGLRGYRAVRDFHAAHDYHDRGYHGLHRALCVHHVLDDRYVHRAHHGLYDRYPGDVDRDDPGDGFTVAFGLRRFNHRFGFDNRLFFTGKQRFQTTKQTAQQTRFGSGWCSLFGCCCRNGGLSSNGFFSRWWCIGGQRERGQSRLFRAFALHRRIFQRLSHLFFVQFRQQVAQGWCFFTLTYAQHRVVWGLHLIVRHDDRFHATLTFLDRAHRFTFFVQQVRSHLNWHDSVNFFGVFFQRFFFDQTKNGQRQRFVITDGAGAVTAWANVMAGFTQ